MSRGRFQVGRPLLHRHDSEATTKRDIKTEITGLTVTGQNYLSQGKQEAIEKGNVQNQPDLNRVTGERFAFVINNGSKTFDFKITNTLSKRVADFQIKESKRPLWGPTYTMTLTKDPLLEEASPVIDFLNRLIPVLYKNKTGES